MLTSVYTVNITALNSPREKAIMACLEFFGFVLGVITADHLYKGVLGGT